MAFSSFNSISSFIVKVNNYVSSTISYIYNFPAVDASLALYYPLDISSNSFTPNYASGLPVYDASLINTMITTNNNSFVMGIGDLSLNNTMGSSTASSYVISNTSFNLVPSNGLSISCWFSCSGQLNTTGTLLTLMNSSTNIEIDISGSNTIYSYIVVPLGVLNKISTAGKTAMLYTGTALQAGAYGLVILNTLYAGPTIQILKAGDSTPVDFYAQSTTIYGTLQTAGGMSLSTFLGGQTAYVKKWYDQTGNGNHASNIGNITYNTTNDTVLFASNYFSVQNSAFPSGNLPYSYLFTPDNQTSTGNAIFQGGSTTSYNWCNGITNYYESTSGNTSIYQNAWYSNTSYYARNLGGGYSNGVKIADCYDGTNGATGRILYYNNISQSYTDGSNFPRSQTTSNNYIGHSEYTGENIVNYTGSFKYFFWAPIALTLSDIIILNNV